MAIFEILHIFEKKSNLIHWNIYDFKEAINNIEMFDSACLHHVLALSPWPSAHCGSELLLYINIQFCRNVYMESIAYVRSEIGHVADSVKAVHCWKYASSVV